MIPPTSQRGQPGPQLLFAMTQGRWRWSLLCSLLLASGCGSGGLQPQPVQGQVLLNNRPLVEAQVLFHPQDSYPESWPKPTAYTDANGRFSLTTLQPNDGAPPGAYQITVIQRQAVQRGEEMIRDGPNLLPPRYADPKTSGCQFRVQAGVNEVPALKLSGN